MRQYIPYITLVISFLGFSASLTVGNHSPTLRRISVLLAVLALLAGTLEVAERWIKTRAESIASEARIAESLAKASKADAEFKSYKRDAEIKAAEDEKRIQELKDQKARSDAQRLAEKAEAEQRQQRAAAERAQEKQRLELELQDLKRREQEKKDEDMKQASNICTSCCEANARKLMPHSTQAVGVCIGECMTRQPSNWFVNGQILCKR